MHTDEIKGHLPFLRRYARALVGDQDRGDGHVRAALEKLVRAEAQFQPGLPARVALFRLFHDSFSGGQASAGASASGPDARLQQLEIHARQALLLTAMEGFSNEEAGQILAMPAGEVDALVARAHSDIETGLKTRVLIIEDEPIIAADLEAVVSDLGHEVCAVARTRAEANAAAAMHAPRLVLADIQLADNSSGIDAANDILAASQMPVIFITAFPERLLTGERPEPAFLITKPFLPNAVKAAISQALFFEEQSRPAPMRAPA